MMRHAASGFAVSIVLAMSNCAAADERVQDFDAVAAAPDSHVVLLETPDVRVLRVIIAPGAAEPVHEHQWPSVMYFEKPQPITYAAYELVEGELVETERVEAPALPDGTTIWADPEGLHSVENRGTDPFIALRVEFKNGASGPEPTQAGDGAE